MPTVIIEGPSLTIEKKRTLVSAITKVISETYKWPAKRIIVIIHENSDENAARGGMLLADKHIGPDT